MKKINLFFALLVLLVASFFAGCLKDKDSVVSELADHASQQDAAAMQNDGEQEETVVNYSSQPIPGQYIVVYKEEALTAGRSMEGKNYKERQAIMRDETAATLHRHSIASDKVRHVYGSAIKGFSLSNATEQEIEKLQRDNQVKYIEQDQVVTVSMGGPPGSGGGGGGSQATPWGITRVGGAVNYTGSGRAWIIDSGIDLDHPDLNVDVAKAVNFASGNSPNDGHGHGTHVAGTVAAINNSEGVVGVAAGAPVVPVRVLGNSGSGSYADVIAGVDYVGANAGLNDAANMSLGGGYSQAVNDAVIAASASCPFALAAGNESTDCSSKSPASANGDNIYTVSSMTSNNDTWSSFSNYGDSANNGEPVDYCAPGSSILSTYKGGGYATMSGTSMASPHVCGILLLGSISSDGNVNGDPDGYPDPIAHH